MLAIFRTDAWAVIVDHNGNALVVRAERHGDPGVRIAQCVTHNVFQCAVQRAGVAEQRPWTGRGGDFQMLAHLLGFKAGVIEYIGPELIGQQPLTDQLAFLLSA
ncbi:hypothetical protein D3C73_1049870 [compost metagenome]